MTQEEKLEKAKVNMDYKERLEKAKELYPTANADQRYVLECLFPELAESEDERTRKEILNVFKQLGKDTTICGRNYDYTKWIAWLEKQGEQKSNPYSGTSFEYNGHIWGMCARDGGAEVSMDGNLKAFISSDASFIYPNIPQPNLALKSALEEFKEEKVDNANKVEQNLANSAKTCKKSQRMVSAEAKEALYDKPAWSDEDGVFEIPIEDGEDNIYGCTNTTPATKEQRDLLFQKMNDAGYEWDAEKKEVKKIHVIDEGKAEMDYCFTKMMNGEKVSPAWSEEDEKNLQGIINAIKELRCQSLLSEIEIYDDYIDWLKSLKQKYAWKPSDEQMDALETLYDNLKRL